MLASASRATYVVRINRVVNYISAHLADPLDLDTLADVAHFSPWHFHRVFQGMTGETLADCVRRHRLEAAAKLLLAQPPQTALHIALTVGFASPEVFSRTFKAHFDCTPTAWRAGAWAAWAEKHNAHLHPNQVRKNYQDHRKEGQENALHFRQTSVLSHFTEGHTMQVEIKTLPATRVAYLRNIGAYGNHGIPKAWDKFTQWCGARGLMTPARTMWGVGHDDPTITAPAHCRYDCCIEVDDQFLPEGEIGVQTIAGGQYACTLFTGNSSTIAAAWMQLFGQWMPSSGYQPANSISLEMYPAGFASEFSSTGNFTFWLCAPVKPL
jgi:AraC family transcriptional regulator